MTPEQVEAEIARLIGDAERIASPDEATAALEALTALAKAATDSVPQDVAETCADDIAEMFRVVNGALAFSRKWASRTDEVTALLAQCDPVVQEYVHDLAIMACQT